MQLTCEGLDDLLLEGDAFSMEQAAKHAAGCNACRERLDAWNDISGTARTMRADWRSDMLWPRIERVLAAGKRRRATRIWEVAAAVVLTVGIGAGSWYAVRTQRDAAAFRQSILSAGALDDVERAERAHVAAIDRLEKVAEPKLENDESPLMVSYKEKLMLLDDAIAECQTDINRNRQNAHLRRELLAIYSEKQKTLQEVLREGNHVSNQ